MLQTPTRLMYGFVSLHDVINWNKNGVVRLFKRQLQANVIPQACHLCLDGGLWFYGFSKSLFF